MRGQQPGKVVRWPALEGDIHHGADEHADHVVEKPVCLNVEFHTAIRRPWTPLGQLDVAVVVRMGLATHTVRLEVMRAGQLAGARGEEIPTHGSAQCPFEGMAERRGRGVVGADDVAIAAIERALAGVEAIGHGVHAHDPAIRREQGIERPSRLGGGPAIGKDEADTEGVRMDSGIGAACGVGRQLMAGEPEQYTFNLTLHGASGGLTLPTLEAAPVELEQCEEGPVHLPESSRFANPEQAAQLLVRIDKTPISPLRFRPDSRTPDCPDVTVLADDHLRLALRKLAHGESLARSESAAAFAVLFAGGGTAAQAGALLMGLRARGETADDLAGAADALRREMRRVDVARPDRLVDTCGTGGGAITTLNLSTAAAFVAAGAGVPIAKHGNRSYTSRSGSADVLEALGVNINVEAERAAGVLEEAGIVFLFAPAFHPAMRFLTPARRELGTPTIMNLLGPLANPAGAGRQVVGVADRDRAPLLAGALLALGSRRAMVVHAEAGMDELSPSGRTRVWSVMNGAVTEDVIEPARLDLEAGGLDGLAGGDPGENARRMMDVLEGRGAEVETAAIVLNAAAAIAVATDDGSMEVGVKRAREALRSGAAREVLERLRKATVA